MTVSIFKNQQTGQPYKAGDVLETKEQAIAFAKAVGWEWVFYIDSPLLRDKDDAFIDNTDWFLAGKYLPFKIESFLPHHFAVMSWQPILTVANKDFNHNDD